MMSRCSNCHTWANEVRVSRSDDGQDQNWVQCHTCKSWRYMGPSHIHGADSSWCERCKTWIPASLYHFHSPDLSWCNECKAWTSAGPSHYHAHLLSRTQSVLSWCNECKAWIPAGQLHGHMVDLPNQHVSETSGIAVLLVEIRDLLQDIGSRL